MRLMQSQDATLAHAVTNVALAVKTICQSLVSQVTMPALRVKPTVLYVLLVQCAPSLRMGQLPALLLLAAMVLKVIPQLPVKLVVTLCTRPVVQVTMHILSRWRRKHYVLKVMHVTIVGLRQHSVLVATTLILERQVAHSVKLVHSVLHHIIQ